MTAREIRLQGLVQGVGFRPHVCRAARHLALAGTVQNDGQGLRIAIQGAPDAIQTFIDELRQSPPQHARIDAFSEHPLLPNGACEFRIIPSDDSTVQLDMPPDLATCDACLCELRNPENRRFRHPFISCTQCGPRHSIAHTLPWDRACNSMADFPQCEACVAEVADSANRRFHSQTNACPDCGPTLIGSIDEAAKVLAEGRIVALKAAGGFQLLCALRNPEAIARLRQRKHRGSKPFSRMYRSIAEIASDCLLSKAERELLASPAAPIALLRPRVTADTPSIGAMLPSTALHHLLLDAFDGPVIATSGNLAGEPIAIANDEAQTRLAPIADYFLMHTRPIIWPLDDSIAMIIDDQPMLIRRARGFRASLLRPDSISPGRLGLGGQLKNTVALSTTDRVLLSPHIGELDSLLSFRNFERQVSHLLERQAPTIVVCDRHPDYRSSLFAETLSLPVKPVQHHIAHARAGIAEHGLRGPVLAVVWDGTGLGDDGQLWGGEWFLVDGDSYTHVARLRDFPLPGGELAIREPRRSAFGLLHELDLQLDLGFTVLETRIMKQQIAQSLKCPRSSAVGRLFDAVSALLGIVRVADYEGHAAIMLEHAISLETLAPYPMSGTDWAPMIQAILEDLAAGTPVGTIANRFHRSLVALIVDTARDLRTPQVLLTGGCFQNRWLLTEAITGLRAASFKAYWPQELPPNDGGLAYGQLACV